MSHFPEMIYQIQLFNFVNIRGSVQSLLIETASWVSQSGVGTRSGHGNGVFGLTLSPHSKYK